MVRSIQIGHLPFTLNPRISVPSPSPILWTSNETTKDVHSFRHAVLDSYTVLVCEHVEHVKY